MASWSSGNAFVSGEGGLRIYLGPVKSGFWVWAPAAGDLAPRPPSVMCLVAPVCSVRHLKETFFEQKFLTLGPSPPPALLTKSWLRLNSSHINVEHPFWFCLQVFCRVGTPQRVDCLAPIGNKRKGIFHGRNHLRAIPFDQACLISNKSSCWLFQACSYLGTFAEAQAAVTNIFQIIDRKPDIDVFSKAGQEPNFERGDVVFNEVNFSFPSRADTEVRATFLESQTSQTIW